MIFKLGYLNAKFDVINVVCPDSLVYQITKSTNNNGQILHHTQSRSHGINPERFPPPMGDGNYTISFYGIADLTVYITRRFFNSKINRVVFGQ